MKKALIVFSMIMLVMFSIEDVFASNSKVIRVGFVDSSNFIYWDEESQAYKGYGVEYLSEIANALNLEIQYVSGSIDECVSMLESGEIDFACPIYKDEERAGNFLFSAYPVGTIETAVYVVDENDTLFFEDYDYLNGKRVGVVNSTIQQTDFRNFASQNGLKYIEVPFENGTELVDAVLSGKTDIFVTTSLFVYTDYQMIASFNASPFYFMYNKEDIELLRTVDKCVAQMKTSNPYFDVDLYNDFYNSEKVSRIPLFNREESDYINNTESVTIGMIPDTFPYSVSVDGKPSGIVEEIIKEISNISGLNIELVMLDKNETPKTQLFEDNEIDIIGGVMRSADFLEEGELITSDAILEFEFEVIAAPGVSLNTLDGLVVAEPKNFPYIYSMLQKRYSGITIVQYESNKECLMAVKNGEADATVVNEFVSSYLMKKPGLSNLSIQKNISFNGSACIVANENVDPIVISIINKTVKCMGKNLTNRIVSEYTILNSYKPTFVEIVYTYRVQIITIFSLVALATVVISHIYRDRAKVVQKMKEEELLKRELEINNTTGLFNKHAFYQRAEQLMKGSEKEFIIIIFDVEKFKIINDLFGMSEGDNLLVHIADKLKKIVKDVGVAGYRGADNFAICIEKEAIDDMQKFNNDMQSYVNEVPLDIKIHISIGIYDVHNKEIAVSLMCDRAKMAASSVKGNELLHFAYYDDSMRQKLLNDQAILNEMQKALEEKQFQVFIQPKCDVDNEDVIGGEALVRWIHPEKGVIPPNEFIPLFEKNGFITKLDYYVWDETCRIIRNWKDAGKNTLPISVNISRMNFYLPGFENVFEMLLKKYNLSTDDLYLEVTESAYTNESEVIFHQLADLQNKKFTILMDDFGSGYSSLNMLQDAPVDVLKLDMKFLLGKDEKHRSEIILESVINMAKQLGFKVIAEGVENKKQCEMLSKLGCQFAQGYYFSKPIHFSEFEERYM